MPDNEAGSAGLSPKMVTLMAVATGLSVAGIYYAQPLLDDIRQSLGLSLTSAGWIVTASQLGYALGLLLLVPLGDLCERRGLVVWMCAGTSAALVMAAVAQSVWVLFAAITVVGMLSAVAQVVVAFAATLALPEKRGRVVGTVMSGLLLGILSARTISGYVGQLGGWRLVFWFAALAMLCLAAVLRLGLPRLKACGNMRYPELFISMGDLLKQEPVLKLRSYFGAAGFSIFSIFWTPLALLLSRPPFSYSTGTIGLLGLVGTAGALAASLAGRMADKGRAWTMTGVATGLLTLSWIPIWLGGGSVWALILGVAALDFAVQALQITNQSEIYTIRPEARSRITSAYMTLYFLGGVAGSALSSVVFAHAGWNGVCILGAADGLVAFGVWLAASLGR